MARPRITRNGQPPRRRGRNAAHPFANIACIAGLISLVFVVGLIVLVVRLDSNNGEETAAGATESLNYLLRLTLPEREGEEQEFSFPVYLTKQNMRILRSSDTERWRRSPILLDTIYQARPHILGAARPFGGWTCMCCGVRPGRTTLGSPAYIRRHDGSGVDFVYDLAPFVLCGSLECENEAKRRTKEILGLAGPMMRRLAESGGLYDLS